MCILTKELVHCSGQNFDVFFHFLFLGKIAREIVFGDFLDRKIAFFDYKNSNLKKSQNMHYSKGIGPW